MTYLWLKTLHIVAVVAWMGGLFYVGRMFVCHVEALKLPEPARGILAEHLHAMTRRAYRGIMTPAIVLTVAFAAGMLALQPALLREPWLQSKLGMVLGLAAYHWYCGKILWQLRAGVSPYGSLGFRLFNEVPTVFLLLICVLAVQKSLATSLGLLTSLASLCVLLVLGVLAYARRRTRPAAAPVPLVGAATR